MKDFIQVGQPHSEWVIINLISGIFLIGVGLGLLIYAVKKAKERKKKIRILKDANSAVFLVFVGAFGAFVMTAGIIWTVSQYYTYHHVTDYQGTFKVVQSEANKIDTTSDSYSKRKITLEDKHGNQQVFEVSDNQVFHKGGKAVVKVKAYGKGKKPSLDKTLGQEDYETNGFEIVSIKPEK